MLKMCKLTPPEIKSFDKETQVNSRATWIYTGGLAFHSRSTTHLGREGTLRSAGS